ncbi:MAG: hypothetical protein RR405_03650 [Clostridia bacterium]
MEYKEDLRIIRTRKLLSSTLLDMMEEVSIEKISVIDLCNRAMVNRATFYAHFEDKYHLLSFALDELKDDVYAKFTNDFEVNSPSEMLKALMNMAIDFIYDERNHITNVISNNRNEKVISTINDSLCQSIKYQFSKYKDTYEMKIPIQLISCFIAGGMVNLALWCIDNHDKCTCEELNEYADAIAHELTFTKKV